ncbi:porin [Mesorhizobium carmichaelinearum]|uniref:porin n=1 Tax=Mesorhizobium carmichaelinearum TaxID=1208188 RepID=UPI000BA4434D|nr:porin [Mesorhizobium carmichaelinearum]
MKIKSLLLGSAAALGTVSDTRAADSVVLAEPELVANVKICDVYGSGYFYIPGTEVCLRIGGFVRQDIGLGDTGSSDGARISHARTGEDQATWRNNTRFTFKTWSAQETALGTLKTYTETWMNFGNRNAYSGQGSSRNYAVNRDIALTSAWFQLGGLRIGKERSAFGTYTGYAGKAFNHILVPYGMADTNVVQYYFDGDTAFSAVVSLEKSSGLAGTVDSYIPHVVVGAKYTQSWGEVRGVFAYDSNYHSVAGKVRVDFNVTHELVLFGMVGYGFSGGLNDDSTNAVNAHGRGFYKQWGGSWAFWTGATLNLNEKAALNIQVSGDQLNNYGAAANVYYTVAPGLVVIAEVDFDHYGDFGVHMVNPSNVNWTTADKKNSVGGILRFERSF